ncbi:MAG: polysaccharide biosynthesis protein [Candidatus Aminicenantes bacterium]|nr:polysaccharide biosynthesis protein [Candidatus Aminicenantes bacterium]
MKRSIVTGMTQYLPAQVVPALVGFFSIPILTHLFPPADYGNYVLVVGTVSVFTTFLGLFSTSIVRFYPACEKEGTLAEIHATVLLIAFLILLFFTLLFVAILIVARSALSPGLAALMKVGVALFVGQSIFLVLPEFFRAKQRITLFSGIAIWRSLAGIGFGLLLVLGFHLGIEGMLWGSILGMLFALPFTWKRAVGDVSFTSRHVSWPLGLQMVGFGLPLVIGNLSSRIIYLSDRYILEFSRSSQEVGIYSASYDIADRTVMLIATLFALTSGSIAFHVWEKEGEQKSRELATSLTRFYLMVALPAAVGLGILARPLIAVLTGSGYHDGARIIPIVILGVFFFGLQQRYQIGLFFHKKTRLIMVSVVTAGIVNVGLNVLLIPRYGFMAAAFITLFSYVLLLALMVLLSRRYFTWDFPGRSLARIAASSAFMAGMVMLVQAVLPWSGMKALLACLFTGVVCYLLGLVLVKEIRISEIKAALGERSWMRR